jgi:hypothetical protein
MTQGSRGNTGNWQSFGNSSGRSMLASARFSGNTMGAGWHSFGNMSHGGGTEISRGYGNNVRAESQWRSFGNSRNNVSIGRNGSGFSSFGAGRATASNLHSAGLGFSPNRFSENAPTTTQFSSFSSFSSRRSIGNFGSSRFGVSGFGGSDFGNSSFGGSGFSNSGIGSGLSLIPNLLGSFLGLGTSVFGGPGLLGANALSLAVRLFVSGISAGGNGQSDFAGGDGGYGQGGSGGDFGLGAAPVWPACGPVAPLWGPAPASGMYCGPSAYQPYGWSSIGYLGGPRISINFR